MKHNKYKVTFTLSLLCFSVMAFGNSAPKVPPGILYDSACGLNNKAAQLALLVINHMNQQRKNLSCHPTLAITAAKKAKSMAFNKRIEHNLDYRAPNELLESHGYLLPAAFLPTSNQVESIAAGNKTAEGTLKGLTNSKDHRSHMLGLSDFDAQQIHIGVGYYFDPNTPHEHHWVVHIAEPRFNQ